MLRDLHETTGGAVAVLDPPGGDRRRSDRTRAGAEHLSRWSLSQPHRWSHPLPELASPRVRLRELRPADAPSLAETLGCPTVGRHLTCLPASLAETEEFIAWTRRARMTGRALCFGVVPQGTDSAVGVFQIWPLEPGFGTAEWGFALGHRYWGSGLFLAGARLVIGFAFDTLDVQRLEARASTDNDRGNAALRKLGAVPEGVLRKCFLTDGEYRDHMMWSILVDDWRDEHPDLAGQATGAVA